MKFSELTKETQIIAKETLKELISRQPAEQSPGFKNLAEYVAAAFVALERFDSAPDGQGVTISDSLPLK